MAYGTYFEANASDLQITGKIQLQVIREGWERSSRL